MTSATNERTGRTAPSVRSSDGPAIRVVATAEPAAAAAYAVPIGHEGSVASVLGLDRAALSAAGFGGAIGETLLVPRQGQATLIAVGIGDVSQVNAASLRDAAAAFIRAVPKHEQVIISLAESAGVSPGIFAQSIVEGVMLAHYRYDPFKQRAPGAAVKELILVAGDSHLNAVKAGAERGRILAEVGKLARDLANAPGSTLTARRLAELAESIAGERGLDIEIFDENALRELGCGGLLGVNAGSAEPPRMIKLTYRPSDVANGQPKPTHLALVGKGIMYDSGGINLKPGDDMHMAMKMDMSGAAAVLASMASLRDLGCKNAVTGYLMCTDNMPSGSAMKMGDILSMRNGMTVEVNNTDAEGRLIMADALVLAAEENPDAIVDIATLTGAAFRALGDKIAAVLGNNQNLVDQIRTAAEVVDEPVWQLPLDRRYRGQLDSHMANMKNNGDAAPAAITAALFLDEFVNGIPWAHIDIAGTMRAHVDDLWRSTGATGFGARLLAELALNITPPH